jgi:hypothetical protein
MARLRRLTERLLLLAGGSIAALMIVCTGARAAEFGPFPPSNPYTALGGAATMHADSESSDSAPDPGPGIGSQAVHVNELGAACPTVLQGSDGMPVALCTTILGRSPTVYLLDPATGAPLASLALPSGNLFGGVYAYLDRHNRLVVFDANGNLLRIAHHQGLGGSWGLSIDSSISIAPALAKRCPALCGGVVGLAPDWRGNVWFATAQAVAGFVGPKGAIRTVVLGAHEQVANSISTAPEGTAIATDHALYLLTAAAGRGPRIVWRYRYDRGPARKPGQLSHGTGATPTFFGPEDGTRYLTITDNAVPAEHLIVIDTWARARGSARRAQDPVGRSSHRLAPKPQVVCDVRVLTPGPSGTENSPVGSGRSVFVASTYGYPYPALPAGAEPSQPGSAPFTGGITRVDLSRDGRGCRVRWQDSVRSAAAPRLDVPDRLLYTIQRTDPLQPDQTGDGDLYSLVAIDPDTGAARQTTPIGAGYESDTLQLAPTIVPGRVLYQGTITGIDRIAPLDLP